MVLLVIITVFVLGIMIMALSLPWINSNLMHGQLVERVWTTVPAVVLTGIGVPSLLLLYALDDIERSPVRLKVIGHQWYWSYELRDFWAQEKFVEFDSYILSEDTNTVGGFRLLEVDNRPVLPYLVEVRALVRSSDVLHSWAVPSLGVKIDAVPGRLNQVKLFRCRPGLAYGQCSEICGANHRFMPITLEFVRVEDFLTWLAEIRALLSAWIKEFFDGKYMLIALIVAPGQTFAMTFLNPCYFSFTLSH